MRKFGVVRKIGANSKIIIYIIYYISHKKNAKVWCGP